MAEGQKIVKNAKPLPVVKADSPMPKPPEVPPRPYPIKKIVGHM